jgi:hypothetical protein
MVMVYCMAWQNKERRWKSTESVFTAVSRKEKVGVGNGRAGVSRMSLESEFLTMEPSGLKVKLGRLIELLTFSNMASGHGNSCVMNVIIHRVFVWGLGMLYGRLKKKILNIWWLLDEPLPAYEMASTQGQIVHQGVIGVQLANIRNCIVERGMGNLSWQTMT